MKNITLLTEPLQSDIKHSVGILFDYAEDSEWLSQVKLAFSRVELIGDLAEAEQKAFITTEKLLNNEPAFRNIQQLTIFKEVIHRELWKIYHVMYLYRFLLENGYKHCQFETPSWWSAQLSHMNDLNNNQLTIINTKSYRINTVKKVFKRMQLANFSKQIIKLEGQNLLNRIDRFHRRNFLFKKPLAGIQNKIWFYTTAHTFTNAALLFAPFLPSDFTYLVENPMTGGYPLDQSKKAYISLYTFGSSKLIPSKSETDQCQKMTIEFLQNFMGDDDEVMAVKMLLKSSWFQLFLERLLPKGLYFSSLLNRWIKETSPKALFVGNSVYEGYALYQAKAHKIPTVLLQHGVICRNYDPGPVDYYVVKGEFWKNNVIKSFQQKTIILNPGYI